MHFIPMCFPKLHTLKQMIVNYKHIRRWIFNNNVIKHTIKLFINLIVVIKFLTVKKIWHILQLVYFTESINIYIQK